MKKTVLIIEDDAWFAAQHVRTLEAAGFAAQCAKDGVEGMAMVDAMLPDAVVLDIFLPGPNALVLLHEMQSHSDLATLPVIICSNNATDIPINSLAPYGVKAVLDKGTMQPGDVAAAIRRVLL